MEELRRVCYQTYKLDSIQYLTCFNFYGHGFLRTCAADVQLFTKREHIELVENMIQGGVSSFFEKRFFKITKSLGNFDTEKEETNGIMVDANNLNGGI